MRKEVLKSLIAIKQSEILFDVIERDVELPIDRKKIITIPGVHSLQENEFPLSGGRYIDLYFKLFDTLSGIYFVIILKRVPERILRMLLEVVNKLNPFQRFQRNNHYFPEKR